MKGLYDKPTIFETKQTTIEKGCIKSRIVIKDTAGNEYKKINGKLEKINKCFTIPQQITLKFEDDTKTIYVYLLILSCVLFFLLICVVILFVK